MLFTCVKDSGHSPAAPKRSAGRSLSRTWLAIFLGVLGSNNATAAPTVLTFAQLAACPVKSTASTEKSSDTLSEKIRSAVGQQVQVTGYMLPLVVENGHARQLLLMRNTMACCYGQSPAANEYVVVKAPPPGLPVTMDVPVVVRGALRVEPVLMGGLVIEYFHLDNAALAGR